MGGVQKYSVIAGLCGLFLFASFLFTGCENFLKSQEVKEEIVQAIDYNNAPYYPIAIEAVKESGTIRTHLSGTALQKVSDVFTVKFEPEDGYKFMYWEAVLDELGQNESIDDYISFEDATSLETKVTFKKAASNILIRPVCPQILKVSLNTSDGEIYPRDHTIQLTFNNPIAQECKDKITIKIPDIPEGKTGLDYFNAPLLSGNTISLFANVSDEDYSKLIPVGANGKTISVILKAGDFYYENKVYSKTEKIYLANDIVFNYTVSADTSKKTKIKYSLADNSGKVGRFRVNEENLEDRTELYSVGKVINLKYTLDNYEDYVFKGWAFAYAEESAEGAQPVFTSVSQQELSGFVGLDEAATQVPFAYDSLTHTAQATLTIYNFKDGVISVSPVVGAINKTQIKTIVDSSVSEAGELKVNGSVAGDNIVEYRPGQTLVLKYKLTKYEDYKFLGWSVKRELTGSANTQAQIYSQDNFTEENLAKLNLSAVYEDNADTFGYDNLTHTSQLTINVNEYIDGEITISPVVVEIPKARVWIDGSNGKLSPAKGRHDVREKEDTYISFEPDTDYEFVYWEVYNSKTNQSFAQASEYIELKNPNESDTTFKLLKVPSDADILPAIRAVVTPRPQVLSYWPMYDAENGSLSDTTIEVVFDCEMDKDSILFTQEELDALPEQGITSKESEIYPGLYYGYENANGERILKNIQITDKRSGKNIAQYFGEPVFEDPTTLFIPVEQPDKLTAGMIIIVTIDKNFFYKETQSHKPVVMSTSQKWRYLVNGSTDEQAPLVNNNLDSATTIPLTFSIAGIGTYPAAGQAEPNLSVSAAWTALENYIFQNGDSIKLTLSNITVTDALSHPSSMFTLEYNRIYDENYDKFSTPENHTKTIEYDFAVGQNATYSGTHELKNLADGVYAVRYIFKDRSGNARYAPSATSAFYFVVDSKRPELNGNLTEVTASRTTSSVTISLPAKIQGANDIKSSEIKCYNADGTLVKTLPFTPSDNAQNVTISGLTAGNQYTVNATLEDYAGHEYESADLSAYTIPAVPDSITCTPDSPTSIKVSFTAPASGYDGFKIYYRKNGSTDNYASKTISKKADTSTYTTSITGLQAKTKYDIYVETKSNNIFSAKSDIVAGFTKPVNATFKSISSRELNTGTDSAPSYKPVFDIECNKPVVSSPYDSLKLYISSEADFPNDTSKTQSYDITSDNSLKKMIQSINVYDFFYEKKYYIRLESSATISGTVVKNQIDKQCWSYLNGVSSFNASDYTNSSFHVSWNNSGKAQDSGLELTIKKDKSAETIRKTVSGSGIDSYDFTGLDGNAKYTITVQRYRELDGNTTYGKIRTFTNVQTPPSPVTNLKITVDHNAHNDRYTYQSSWTNPPAPADMDVPYTYIKYYAKKGNKVELLREITGITYYSILGSGNSPQTSYWFYRDDLTAKGFIGNIEFVVRVGNDSGYSDTSVPLATPFTGIAQMLDFSGLTDSSTSTKVNLTWNNLYEANCQYLIYYWLDGQTCPANPNYTLDSSASSKTVEGLQTGKKYHFKLAVADMNGNPFDGSGEWNNVSKEITCNTEIGVKDVTYTVKRTGTMMYNADIIVNWTIPSNLSSNAYSNFTVVVEGTLNNAPLIANVANGVASVTFESVEQTSFSSKIDDEVRQKIERIYVKTNFDSSGNDYTISEDAEYYE